MKHVYYASMQSVKLSTKKSIMVIKAKIVLESYVETYVVGDQGLVIHDHNRPLNIFGF